MDLGLDGQVAIVVGATEGMGHATAQALARAGMRLTVVARSADRVTDLPAELTALGAADVLALAIDVSLATAGDEVIAATLRRWDTVDALVNTVGLCEVVRGGILDQDDGYWERSFGSVLMPAVRTCRAALPGMLAAGHGAIVNVSAMSSRHYLPMIAHYSAQKLALAHFTKNIAKEFGSRGIRANAVMPGMIESDGVAARKAVVVAENGWTDDEYFAYVNAKYDGCTWASRLGQPAEIARAIAWLISDQASYVNGAWLPVDGGSSF